MNILFGEGKFWQELELSCNSMLFMQQDIPLSFNFLGNIIILDTLILYMISFPSTIFTYSKLLS